MINPLTGAVLGRIPTGRRPYRILFYPDGKSLLVTSWADGTVTRYQAIDGSPLGSVRLGPHPTDMLWRHAEHGNTLYIAAANTNTVFSVAVPDSGEMVSRGIDQRGFECAPTSGDDAQRAGVKCG